MCGSHLKQTIYNKDRAYAAALERKAMKAPFSMHWTGAFAMDITIHDISTGTALEMHSKR